MAASDQNDTVYSTRTLSKWFFFAAFALLVTVIWAVIGDYDREWKHYQRQWKRVVTELNQHKLKKAEMAIDQSKLAGLEKQIAELESKQTSEMKLLQKKIDEADVDFYQKNQKYQFEKAELDSQNFFVDHAMHENSPNKDKIKADFKALSVKVAKLKDDAFVAESLKNTLLEEKKKLLAAEQGMKDQVLSLTLERERLKKAIAKSEASLLNTVFNAPVIDFIAPTIKINQIILNDLKDDYAFNKVPRVDRCMTCHVNADKPGFEQMPQPFKSHPKLDLMLSANSPHPVEKIGCTVCHAGVPQSADFSLAAHTPNSIEQEAEWKEKYHYHRSHHIGTPMVPLPMTEGKCLQCHSKQQELVGAPTFNAGMKLIENYGCYNCHKFAGHFEQLAKKHKTGPTLKYIASKLDPVWVRKWLWDPKGFRPTTLMPQYWRNHNNSDPESLERGAVEVDAIAHFLYSKAEKFEPIQKASAVVGDAKKGKETFGSVGCLGCHASSDFPGETITDPTALGYKDARLPMFGPELNQMGSKVNEAWLYSWLINPKHYNADTRMPSFRLSPKEAADIAAYLLEKKNTEFDASKPPVAKDEVRDSVIRTYFEQLMSKEESQVKLASMSIDEKRTWLGQKMVGHYGCYACHAISGFEGAPNIGAELTTEGSKDTSKFAYDNVEIFHKSRADWIFTKVRTPRIFDVGKERDFEAKTRMPHFGFTKDQATAIAAIVIGHENPNVDESAKFKVNGRWEQIITGQAEARRLNCIGCHSIENKDGYILSQYPNDPSMGPPNLNTQGRKTRPEFLFGFLKSPYPIRPWLQVRMPTFGLSDDQSSSIVKYFAAYDKEHNPFYTNDHRTLSAGEYAEASKLFGTLGCLTCHGVRKPGEDVSAAAPHLNNVKVRLRGTWVKDWLKNPNTIMPGTRMPQLWPPQNADDPKSPLTAVPGYFGDDAEKQIEMIRNFIFMYGGAPTIPEYVPVPRTPTYETNATGSVQGKAL